MEFPFCSSMTQTGVNKARIFTIQNTTSKIIKLFMETTIQGNILRFFKEMIALELV